MIKIFIKCFIILLRNLISNLRLKKRFKGKGGECGNPISISNIEYVSIGNNVRIKDGFRIDCYPSFYGKIYKPSFIIGDGVNIGHRFTALVADRLVIKKDTILAGNVTLITENHGMDPECDIPYHAQDLSTGPIEIGEGCWLGQNVVVLPNVTIGNKCVIATNAVVTKSIPDYSIAVGCPARVIKRYNFKLHQWERV